MDPKLIEQLEAKDSMSVRTAHGINAWTSAIKSSEGALMSGGAPKDSLQSTADDTCSPALTPTRLDVRLYTMSDGNGPTCSMSNDVAPKSVSSPSASADRLACTSELSDSTEDEAAATETPELRALPMVVAAVQRRHPTASIALVERCIHDAVQTFRDARVRLYLPILIERLASDAVRDTVTRADEALRDIRGSTVPAATTANTEPGPVVTRLR
jgi:hypothetical protein